MNKSPIVVRSFFLIMFTKCCGKVTNRIVMACIALTDESRQRIIDIASGKYRVKLGEPKIWFTSKSSLAQALNDKKSCSIQFEKKLDF